MGQIIEHFIEFHVIYITNKHAYDLVCKKIKYKYDKYLNTEEHFD